MHRFLIPALLVLPLPAAAQSIEELAAAFAARVAHDGVVGEEFNSVRMEIDGDCTAQIIVLIQDGDAVIDATLVGNLSEVDPTTLTMRGSGDRTEMEFDLEAPELTWTVNATVPAGDEAYAFLQAQIEAGELAGSCTAEACTVSDGFDNPSIPIPSVSEDEHASLMSDFVALVAACDAAVGN